MKFLFGICLAICVGFAVSITQPPSDRFKKSVAVIEAACRQYISGSPINHFNRNVAEPDEFPWMAALSYFDKDTNTHLYKCGGTIISEKFILTAAHCMPGVYERGSVPNKVCLGRVNLNYANANNFYDIKETIRHPYYRSEFLKDDIALIELTRPIEFSQFIRPACLETNLSDLDSNVQLIVTGWGITLTSDLAIPDQLLKATVRTVPLPLCNDAFDPISNDYAYPSLHNGISESQYCAVDPNGLSSPCTGDDGGPLQVFHNIRTAHVVGIVSFGIGCNATMPHIYTRVAYYSEWIVTTVWPDKFNRTQETTTLSMTITTTQSPETIRTTAIPTSVQNIAIDIINEECNNNLLPSPTNYIINGTSVKPDINPWMAALGYIEYGEIVYKCAGVLISESFVLTAAHCCLEGNEPVIVRLGTVNLIENTSKNYRVRDTILHEKYDKVSKLNDIALIKLTENVISSTPNVRPACLNTELGDENPNTPLKVMGWGSTSDGVMISNKQLLEADVVTVPMSECNQTVLNYNKRKHLVQFQHGISESQYCARNRNRRAGTCHGDSGGPLQVLRNQYVTRIVGITSFGIGCNTSFPGIYTRVASYSDWIVSHVWPQ